MDSAVQASLPISVLSSLRISLACGFVGVIISTGVYGITILQAYIYFRNNSQDSGYMRSFVIFLFILDTVSAILTINGVYEYSVTNFGDPSLLLGIPPTFAFERVISVMMGALTQCFFAHRLWALSQGNIILATSIVILALCSLGPGIAFSVRLDTNKYIFSLTSMEARILMGFANGLSVVCDVIIAAALSYYLHSKRTGFKSTDSMINCLIIYAVNRGALTAFCQAGEMITLIALPARERFIFIPFAFLTGRLYCNTLLATLNAQRSLGREADSVIELGTNIFNRRNTSALGNEHHRQDGNSDRMPSFVIDITIDKTVDAPHIASIDDNASA